MKTIVVLFLIIAAMGATGVLGIIYGGNGADVRPGGVFREVK